MLQKINQKCDKTPKFNTRNTHQYQLVHFRNIFQLQQHATVSAVTWHMQCAMEVMVYITCYCLSPFQHLPLQTSTWIQITCDITRGVYYRQSFLWQIKQAQ